MAQIMKIFQLVESIKHLRAIIQKSAEQQIDWGLRMQEWNLGFLSNQKGNLILNKMQIWCGPNIFSFSSFSWRKLNKNKSSKQMNKSSKTRFNMCVTRCRLNNHTELLIWKQINMSRDMINKNLRSVLMVGSSVLFCVTWVSLRLSAPHSALHSQLFVPSSSFPV